MRAAGGRLHAARHRRIAFIGGLPAIWAAEERHAGFVEGLAEAGCVVLHPSLISLGGAIAMRIALDHPDEVRALVGVVPWNAAGTTADDEVLAGFDAAYGNVEALTQAVAAIS